MPKNNFLFVTEKWCDARPDLGFTHNFNNYFYTFSQYEAGHLNMIHLDESFLVYDTHIDEVLVDFCVANKIKVIFFSLLGDSPLNPSMATLQKLKNLGVYLCYFWHDTGPGWAIQTIGKLKSVSDLHLAVDNSSYQHEYLNADNFLTLWTPQNKNLYYPQKQDIEVSFVGSPRYSDRMRYLTQLFSRNPKVVIRGGQREEKLSINKYAELIRRSKIGLNFASHSLGFSQTKGRVYEIIGSGSLLLEDRNPQTAKLFTPNEDYIEFDGIDDLVNKIEYYSTHEDERAKIAKQGYEKFVTKYTSWHFWDTVVKRIEKDLDAK